MIGSSFADFVASELILTRRAHDVPIHSGHEALGVILEEFEEFKEEVKRKDFVPLSALRELVQMAAMCQRAAEDLQLVQPSRQNERRLDRMAAFLYGTRWTVGQPAWNDLSASARRQWVIIAEGALQELAA